jgi:hypothetical protein
VNSLDLPDLLDLAAWKKPTVAGGGLKPFNFVLEHHVVSVFRGRVAESPGCNLPVRFCRSKIFPQAAPDLILGE